MLRLEPTAEQKRYIKSVLGDFCDYNFDDEELQKRILEKVRKANRINYKNENKKKYE